MDRREYRPRPGDWYGETKQYLYRIRDGWRRLELIWRKCCSPEACTDELHQELAEAQQDMKIVTAEVVHLIGSLPDENQRAVMTGRYVYGQNWREIAEGMQISVDDVIACHQAALPILKREFKKMKRNSSL